MFTKPVITLVFAAPFVALALLAVNSAGAAPTKEPSNCTAIAFRPVLSRGNNGVQDAWLYKSRFGRIQVKAEVKNGVAERYFLQIDGKALAPAPNPLSAMVTACAKAKRVMLPTTPESVCIGDQLTVLIEHSSEARFVLLYAHRAGTWRFCSAGIARSATVAAPPSN